MALLAILSLRRLPFKRVSPLRLRSARVPTRAAALGRNRLDQPGDGNLSACAALLNNAQMNEPPSRWVGRAHLAGIRYGDAAPVLSVAYRRAAVRGALLRYFEVVVGAPPIVGVALDGDGDRRVRAQPSRLRIAGGTTRYRARRSPRRRTPDRRPRSGNGRRRRARQAASIHRPRRALAG